MPVKIRCRGCEKVLNVPDRARGKAIRCPNCESTMKVPAGDAGGSREAKQQGGRRRRRPAGAAVPGDGDDFLTGVDLRHADDRRVRVCVKCGFEPEPPDEDEGEEELIDCPECGHNIDTGVMSERIREKRARRGPDRDGYFGKLWKDPFQFIKKNISAVFITAGYWAFFQANQIICFEIAQNVDTTPPFVFWMTMGFLSTLGMGGWLWLSTTRIIRHTMGPKRNKKFASGDFDKYECFSLGLKSIFWSYMLGGPIMITLTIIYTIPLVFGTVILDTYMPAMICSAVVAIFCVCVYPIAMVHMTMPYTYKAWLPVNIVVITAKNIVPTLCWLLVAVVIFSPAILVLVILQVAYEGGLLGLQGDVLDWALVTCQEAGVYIVLAFGSVGGFFGTLLGALVTWFLFYLMLAATAYPICLILSFPAIYTMRANGLLALYFREDLELVKEQKAGVPCGFGPRYLAALVDVIVLYFLTIGLHLVVLLLAILFALVGAIAPVFVALYVYPSISGTIIPALYFARPQSNKAIQASIGKWSLGLVVLTEDDETMTFIRAVQRYFSKLVLGIFTLGVSYLFAAFSEYKQALHDRLRHTKVVWKGDDERSLY